MATESNDPQGKASESVGDKDGSANASRTSSPGRFWMLLVPLILFAAAGGAWMAYGHYDQVTKSVSMLQAQLGMNDESNPNAPIEYGKFMELKNIVANPANTKGGRYLMVNIGFESDEQAVLDEIESKEIVVRDEILNLLSNQTPAQLSDIDRRDSIKTVLRQNVNRVLREGEVQRLYFTQYVLQ